MSLTLINAVMSAGPVFTRSERAVLQALAHHASEENLGRSWPSKPQLAISSGLSERHVGRVLLDLEDLDCVAIRTGGGRRSNTYFLNATRLVTLAGDLKANKDRAQAACHDRFKAVQERAKVLRHELIAEMQTTPERGKRWRDRRRKEEAARESYRTKKAVSGDRVYPRDAPKKISATTTCHPTPDSRSHPTPDMESGVPCHQESSEPEILHLIKPVMEPVHEMRPSSQLLASKLCKTARASPEDSSDCSARGSKYEPTVLAISVGAR